jgi:F-type H+-transporting ATPase subunit a
MTLLRRAAPIVFAVLALAAASPRIGAQEPKAGAAAPDAANKPVDYITPHISDSYTIDVPYWLPPFVKEICLGRHEGEACTPLWEPVRIGPVSLQLSPTKHVVMLLLAATLCAVALIGAARAHVRYTQTVGHPKGAATGIEALVLYMRNEIILPNVGPHGDGYVPYLLTTFFLILFANYLGLLPYASTATGNISVTAMLAIISFLVTEISGIIALGPGYLNTIFYWNKDLGPFLRVVLFLVMTPVEIMSKLTKPFALAIRLFANMTSGHIVVLAFIGLIFTFGSALLGLASLASLGMAVGIMLLELLVGFLQAFIFTLLTSSFIGQVREAHH